MLFLTDRSCSSEVETLFCMNMQLFRIRVKGRQGLVALFKYTLLSSIMLKFFTLPPPPAHILPPPTPPRRGTLRHALFTLEAVCHPSGALTVVSVRCVDGRTSECWRWKQWPWPPRSTPSRCTMRGTRNIYGGLEVQSTSYMKGSPPYPNTTVSTSVRIICPGGAPASGEGLPQSPYTLRCFTFVRGFLLLSKSTYPSY